MKRLAFALTGAASRTVGGQFSVLAAERFGHVAVPANGRVRGSAISRDALRYKMKKFGLIQPDAEDAADSPGG